jgi:hypothetical protein
MIRFSNLRKLQFAGVVLIISFLFCTTSSAVTSNIVKQSGSEDFLKGKTENVVISSRGTLELALKSENLIENLEDTWSVNQIVTIGNDIYLGTSPNGGIYRYNSNGLEKIYPAEKQNEQQDKSEISDANSPADSNSIEEKTHLQNEHIFAMSKDVTGRLIAGISGKNCRLMRFQRGEFRTIFEPNDASYIFSIEVATPGEIYVGTGPEGKIYKLDSMAEQATLLFDSDDKNILSLSSGGDNILYAGSDTRGLVYKIDTETKQADVLYDSDFPEINSVISWNDKVYAAGTSAKIKESETEFAANQTGEGRPESNGTDGNQKPTPEMDNPVILKIPNSSDDSSQKKPPRRPRPERGKQGNASTIYKVDKQGFVQKIFQEKAVFFCMTKQGDKLLLGTGGNGQLFRISPSEEIQKVIYDDPNAPQITSVATSDRDILIGTANPAKLIRLTPDYSPKAVYTSEMIDADQPARWGKLQIDASIPESCEVLVAVRSGNVKDTNAPTLSEWTEYKKVTKPVNLDCPVGRFCQYKLLLKTDSPDKTPIIREVAIANTIPNIAPQVQAVTIESPENKPGALQISYKAEDDNSDKLIYKIDFRQTGWDNWIEIEDSIEEQQYIWDTRTVEDGRYEIKVIANDRKSNSEQTALTASRVSDQFVVDNTAPELEKISFSSSDSSSVLISLTVTDNLSVITNLEYTIDSSKDWMSSVPEDIVFDTTKESFEIKIDNLKRGKHILSLKMTDAAGNTSYKNIQF